MRRLAVLMALALLTMHDPAAAGDRFSYNQLDLNLGTGLLNSGDTYFGLGWKAGASVELTSHLFAFGSLNRMRYSELHLDDDGIADLLHGYFSDDDAEPLHHAPEDDSEHVYKRGNELGLGLNWALDQRHDVFVGVSRLHQRLEREADQGDGIPQVIVRGDGPNVRLGLRGGYGKGPKSADLNVAVNVGWLDSDIARTSANGIPRYSKHTLAVLGVTAGVRVQTSRYLGVGAEVSAVHFAGDTELRWQLGVRIQLPDWDGPQN